METKIGRERKMIDLKDSIKITKTDLPVNMLFPVEYVDNGELTDGTKVKLFTSAGKKMQIVFAVGNNMSETKYYNLDVQEILKAIEDERKGKNE